MLRELELLPAWHVRMPPVLEMAAAMPQTAPVSVGEQVSLVAEKAAPPDVTETAPELPVIESPTLMPVAAAGEPENVSLPNWQPNVAEEAPMHSVSLDAPVLALEVDHPVEDIAAETPAESVATLIQSPWLIYSTRPVDAPSQQLLQNIMQAMQLPADEVTVTHEPLQRAQVSSRFCVLFGLAAANQFLNVQHTEIAAVRGQLHAVGDLWCVVTHDLAAMLQTPALKREVWQDLCLLLAKKSELMA
ncbi:DNA polymerase III subunit psi [Methylophilus sp. 13]|nr:DNA polymerase III subunit psi [Methylophilus sp. 13]